jgi:hypothetical protein
MTAELNLAKTPGSASTSACLGMRGTLESMTDRLLPLMDWYNPNALGLAGTYALYAAAAAVSLPFVWARVRETRGKTLEQM